MFKKWLNAKLVIIFCLLLLVLTIIIYVTNAIPGQRVSGSGLSVIHNFGQVENREKDTKYVSPISIDYLRSIKIDSDKPVIEKVLADGSNYKQYLASYKSEDLKVFGLLTVPATEPPEKGFSAIVFLHGYIPPSQYVTTERYTQYVDYLAKNGFVVFKIDLRGNGQSEGIPTGSYFSPAYTIDAISALKSLQKSGFVDPEKIGLWGHSMSGNAVLRAMLVSDEVKAGVIWSGAVYSYEDFAKYSISDNSYVADKRLYDDNGTPRGIRENSEQIRKFREAPEETDFTDDFWKSISLTSNIHYLRVPLQLDHAVNDSVVNIGYSRDLAEVLEKNDKKYELNELEGGGHNINSPYFEKAMQATVEFFKKNL